MSSGSVHFTKPIKTWKDVRERNIVMQRFDYSCGAAAMATLMNYYFEDNITERDILIDIVEQLDQEVFETRKRDGLSLLDLKEFAERRGYQAVGVRLQPTTLARLPGPILVYLERPDYKHFAVLRGVRGDRVYLADPSRGNLRMPVDRFLQEWPGIALVMGKQGFGLPDDTALAVETDGPIRPEIQAIRSGIYTGI
jgi:predicted double-glycine peptidase